VRGVGGGCPIGDVGAAGGLGGGWEWVVVCGLAGEGGGGGGVG